MTETIRLAKHLAGLLQCSRREAEQYIEGGWVSVAGQIVEEPGHRVSPGDRVEVSPHATLDDIRPVTILLHKPAGHDANESLDSARDLIRAETLASDDRSGQRFLKKHLSNLTLVAPLESMASGLVVYSQEYSVTRRLVDASRNIEHEYVVDVAGDLAPDGLARLAQGLSWRGMPLEPIKVSWQSENRLRFALKTPPAGLIAHLCSEVGLQALAIKRLRIGRLPMAGLPAGQWRYRLGYERF
jgi:23S rRNA pseudouridine2604 synthase